MVNYSVTAAQKGDLLECLYFSILRRKDLVDSVSGDWEWLDSLTTGGTLLCELY